MNTERLQESIPINIYVHVMECFMQKWNLLKIIFFPKPNFKRKYQLEDNRSIVSVLFIATLRSRNHLIKLQMILQTSRKSLHFHFRNNALQNLSYVHVLAQQLFHLKVII